MSILFVLSEHSAALDDEARQRYERVRGRLEAAAGEPVAVTPYENVGDLGGVDTLVLSGSRAPWAEHPPGALDRLGRVVVDWGGPVLGICAGMQLQALFAGGRVETVRDPAEGRYVDVEVLDETGLLRGVPGRASFFSQHTDDVVELPPDFRVLARSGECEIEALADPVRRWWGTQFHPEEFSAEHPHGERVLANFFALRAG